MMVSGIIVSVDFDKQIKGKAGYYSGWEVTYKDNKSGEIKTLAKPTQTLKAPKLSFIKPVLDTLGVGDTFNYTLEKEGDFWEITNMSKGDVPQLASGSYTPRYNKAPTRDFPSAEERAKVQKYIIRQSSLTTAVEFASLTKSAKSKEELFELAAEIEQWVSRNE